MKTFNRWAISCMVLVIGLTSCDNHSKPNPGLDKNPGKTGEMFTDSHPYIKEATKSDRKTVDKYLEKNVLKSVGDERLNINITAVENEIRMNTVI